MNANTRTLVVVVTLVVVGALAALLWRAQHAPEPAAPPAPQRAPSAPAASASPALPRTASAPAVAHEIEMPPPAGPLAAEGVADALTGLLGSKAVLAFLQTQNFAQRMAATVDNLGRSHASAAMWPVNPTPGRFTVQGVDGASAISTDNALRYAPFVQLVESIDVGRMLDLYVRMYPLLQQAYADLGYPQGYFNDRVVEVIDQLLATPDGAYPIKVRLTEVKGPIPSARPWVRYEFADPALESLSAGQKILLRMGAVNERRLKARLAEIRKELLKRAKSR